MLNLQNNRSIYIYGAAAVSLAVLGSGIAYYIIEDDRQVRRRKAARRAERTTLRLLHQIKEEQQAIESKMSTVESNIDEKTCDDKAFRLKEYTLAHSNELLLQLMEKLDAIRPLTVIMIDTDAEPNEFELGLVENVKTKKRSVIESIQGLFRRLDIANSHVKKEASRREEEAKEKARLEKEEAERKAHEEKEREQIRKENERKLKEEQERIAQEEALRRQKEEEEEQRLAQEEALKESQAVAKEEEEVSSQEEVVLAALKQVELEEQEVVNKDAVA